jgi:spermidine synthase
MDESPSAEFPRFGLLLLLLAIFSAAACAILYELLIGSVASYFLGNSVEQFSLTIGFFLASMGLGSWLSRFITARLLERFALLEIWLGLLGGISVAVLYTLYGYTDYFQLGMLALIALLGTLIGLEVPLLTRILRGQGSLRSALSSVLSMDYLGSLVAALLFPYVLLPFLGSMHTALVAGLANAAIGLGVVLAFRSLIAPVAFRALTIQAGMVIVALSGLVWQAEPLLERWESDLYEDRIVHSVQSPYQKVVLTLRDNHLRLYLNGHLQFASVDEYRYHEALVHPAMSLAHSRERVLIIGGGDGLTAREVLKYEDVERIDLVDLDPEVIRLARRNIHMTRLNDNALNRPQVHVVNEDGFLYLQRDHMPYGAIFLDLPDPREESLAKLYSVEAYMLCRRLLGPGGVLATQATSPYYAREAYWSIAAALVEAGFAVHSYHLHIPSFGEWGFHLAGTAGLDPNAVEFSVPARYIDRQVWSALSIFDRDMGPLPVSANRLDKPVLARYYRSGWNAWF